MQRCAASVWVPPFTGFKMPGAGHASRSLNGWKRRDAEDAEKRAGKESLYGFHITAFQIRGRHKTRGRKQRARVSEAMRRVMMQARKGMGEPASNATAVVAEWRKVIGTVVACFRRCCCVCSVSAVRVVIAAPSPHARPRIVSSRPPGECRLLCKRCFVMPRERRFEL